MYSLYLTNIMAPSSVVELILICIVFNSLITCEAVRCYQCSSHQDPKGEDNCGAYEKFRKDRQIAVECNSDESVSPGSFCMKITQQGPRGFIWDGRWRQVIRRCASVADTGVTGVCNWGVYDNGIYWEECYCSEDECNASEKILSNFTLVLILSFVSFYVYNFA